VQRRLKRWGVVLGCLLVVFGVAAVLIGRWANGSSAGTAHTGTAATKLQPALAPLSIDTPYFTTQLPGTFTVRDRTETPGAPAVQFRLVANGGTTTDQQFAVTVGTLPSEGLRGIGDYNLRSTQTQSYTPYQPTGLPEGAVAFRASSGPAGCTVFWPHGSRYVALAMSTDGGASLEQLRATYSSAIATWVWK